MVCPATRMFAGHLDVTLVLVVRRGCRRALNAGTIARLIEVIRGDLLLCLCAAGISSDGANSD